MKDAALDEMILLWKKSIDTAQTAINKETCFAWTARADSLRRSIFERMGDMIGRENGRAHTL